MLNRCDLSTVSGAKAQSYVHQSSRAVRTHPRKKECATVMPWLCFCLENARWMRTSFVGSEVRTRCRTPEEPRHGRGCKIQEKVNWQRFKGYSICLQSALSAGDDGRETTNC
jgi:hypothetical protein